MLRALPFWYLLREVPSSLDKESECGACIDGCVLPRGACCPHVSALLLREHGAKAGASIFVGIGDGFEEPSGLSCLLWGVLCYRYRTRLHAWGWQWSILNDISPDRFSASFACAGELNGFGLEELGLDIRILEGRLESLPGQLNPT